MNFKKILCVITFFIACSSLYAQTVTIKGIVVDSLSLASIPNVTIKIKRNGQGMFTDSKGAFVIQARNTDTLLFSSVGYQKFEYPLFDDEEDVLIRLKENYTLLKEVDVYAPIKDKYVIKEHKIVTPSLGEGIFSPFTYFSKTEHEKRRLIKLRLENKKIRTYVQIVNDPDLKDEIMDKFSINENEYYETLAMFNQQNRQAAYMTNPVDIKRLLFNFFKLHTR